MVFSAYRLNLCMTGLSKFRKTIRVREGAIHEVCMYGTKGRGKSDQKHMSTYRGGEEAYMSVL